MFDARLLTDAKTMLDRCRAAGIKLALAESCTGGLIAACLTEIPGASDVLERGLVVYSNAAKTALLGVPAALLEREGAVSDAVACAMAEGALGNAPVELALAVTGIAGPGGGSEAKPVGLVHFAVARKGGKFIHRAARFTGDRRAIRMASVAAGIELLGTAID
ncbi:MAG: CinA family protein [Alphaproteobacteria bacterium]|nr:CinA family protein [Alphaproteobacteria bacterium]